MSADFPTGLAALADRYDAFVFDLWGVLHDGVTLYPGVLPALRALKERGRRIGLMSNSPRPTEQAAANIADKFALMPDCYNVLLTSGQLAYEAVRDRPDDWLRSCGTRCLAIGPAHETEPYLALGLQPAQEPAQADFVLCTGLTPGKTRLADYEELLQDCARAGLKFICANPDRVVMRSGQLEIAGGALAEHYRDLGGAMRDDFGKPYPAIFRRMLAALDCLPERALMIGDNLATDIAGAGGVGMANLWITGGVHAPELAGFSPEALRSYAVRPGLNITHIMPQVAF